MDPKPGDVTELLANVTQSNPELLDKVVPLLYSELHRVASSYLRRERSDHTLQATALVNEAYLRLVQQKAMHWENRDHFIGVAAQLMRRILVDYGRGRRTAKRGGGAEKVVLEETLAICKQPGADVVALDEALNRLGEFDPLQARIVELRFFGGLTAEKTAAVLSLSTTTVKRNWNVAKAWLARELAADRKVDERKARPSN